MDRAEFREMVRVFARIRENLDFMTESEEGARAHDSKLGQLMTKNRVAVTEIVEYCEARVAEMNAASGNGGRK